MSDSYGEGALYCDNGLRKRKVTSPKVDIDAVRAALEVEGVEGEEANMDTDGKSPKAFGRSPDGTSTFIQLTHMLNYNFLLFATYLVFNFSWWKGQC
jgi:hypothetical protein